MTWDAFHRRGEVLRNVLEHAETHRDGRLPMELAGVAETFGDELSLLGALQLRWHTRLAGSIERELLGRPMDPAAAVMSRLGERRGGKEGVMKCKSRGGP